MRGQFDRKKEFAKMLSTWIDEPADNAIKQYAETHGISFSQAVRELLSHDINYAFFIEN